MAYDTTEAVAKFLSGFQMKITKRERDTVAPDYYVKYLLTLSKGGKDFSTTFVSDPRAFGEPTVTQVFSALADDVLTLQKYSTDEFVDKLYAQGVKPSAALRAYNSCKETNLWMQDELYLSGWEIEEISKTLTKYEDEVDTLVEKAASERAARYAYDHPKLPKGFVTIEQLQGDLDLGDLRDEVEDFDFDGDLTNAFSETADYKVDSNYHALLSWLPDHTEWLEQAEFDGLLEGCKGDIYKMVQMAQYECFKSDLYDHREDICRYGTLDQLRDMGVYAIRESLADEILNDLSYDEDYAPTDDAKDTIMGAVSAAFEERYGEDFAEVATDFGQDIDDIAGRANPCILSVDTVRAVNEKGYDAVFAEQWKTELSECDIDPEAVSVDSEAHDMENGRDGLDGNAPEKDAPEKDDRDAQSPLSPSTRTSMPPPIALRPVSVGATFSPTARFRRSGTKTARFTLPVPTMTGAYPSRCVSSPMRANAFGDSSITKIICPSKGLPPWESTMSLAMRSSSSTTSITARNSAPPPVTWSSPSDALLRNTRKRK